MKTELCLIICFFVGVLVFYLLKQSCGCKVVEGQSCIGEIGVGRSTLCKDCSCFAESAAQNVLNDGGTQAQANAAAREACIDSYGYPLYTGCTWDSGPSSNNNLLGSQGSAPASGPAPAPQCCQMYDGYDIEVWNCSGIPETMCDTAGTVEYPVNSGTNENVCSWQTTCPTTITIPAPAPAPPTPPPPPPAPVPPPPPAPVPPGPAQTGCCVSGSSGGN